MPPNSQEERLRYDRLSAFRRAKELFERGDPQSLRYAALEARLCLEAFAYDKLRMYEKRLAPDLLGADSGTWQPEVVLRALREIEPGSDSDIRMRFTPTDGEGNAIGPTTQVDHLTLKVETLDHYYQRLASYLHVPTVKRQQDHAWILRWQGKLRDTLEGFFSEIGPRVRSAQSSGLTISVNYPCEACEKFSVVDQFAAILSKRARCIHCGAMHVVEVPENPPSDVAPEDMVFHLDATAFDCLSCGTLMPIENRKLEVGLEFSCKNCRTNHLLIQKHWGYGAPGIDRVSEPPDGGALEATMDVPSDIQTSGPAISPEATSGSDRELPPPA
ncbi:MAG: hypothetical protein WEG36_12210 [Gemmatimonadota bacterium]